MMRLTHVFDRVHCRWVWKWLTQGQWSALPHVAVLTVACGGLGGAAALPAQPGGYHPAPAFVPVSQPYAPPSELVFLPPSRPSIDFSPALAPDSGQFAPEFNGQGGLANVPGIDSSSVERASYDNRDDKGHDHTSRGDSIPEPGALLGVALVGLAAVRGRRA